MLSEIGNQLLCTRYHRRQFIDTVGTIQQPLCMQHDYHACRAELRDPRFRCGGVASVMSHATGVIVARQFDGLSKFGAAAAGCWDETKFKNLFL